ncbi:MAG: thiol-disulfide oxidoreductase DCC family protein [Ignavibacteriaceae bacterium]
MDRYIILFDGCCNLCNFWVDFIIKKDKKNLFKFASLQSSPAEKFLSKFDLNREEYDSIILVKEENYFTKSTAALKIIKEFGNFWKIFYILILIPKFIRDFVYDFIAEHRFEWFGKRNICRIPTEKEKSKFL